MKAQRLIRIVVGIVAILSLLHLIFWLTDTTYIYKALIFNYADIDDYKIFHNRTIKAKSPEPLPVRKNKNISPSLQKLHDSLKTVAFLVVKNDTIVYEQYAKPYHEHALSNSFSMAKSVVSILVGIAYKEGLIKSLDTPVHEYLPEFKEGDKAKITIRHCLMMASGLNFQERYNSPFNHTTESYYGTDLRKLVRKLKVIHTPGTVHRYKGSDPLILSFILNKVTGKTVSEYMSEKLWTPIHAVDDALWSLDKENGDEKSYCCINSNARDFARIGLLYLHKGNWKGKQIVDTQYVEQSLTPLPIPDEKGNKAEYYGYMWWLMSYKNQSVFYARGILGQLIIVIPSKNIVIVRLGEKIGKKDGIHPIIIKKMIDEVLEW
ncbi:MAG: beta-lactamase family protein [Bacteroidia bacterium]|nr:beta-lactamase family protein [Bacteroidia bacterium]MDW8302697.1 serine hydrolase [Bacteroidia bacterium]